MKCEHCNYENLGKYIKCCKIQTKEEIKYFRYCKKCGYNSYHIFPEYLDESQFDKYINHKEDYLCKLEN